MPPDHAAQQQWIMTPEEARMTPSTSSGIMSVEREAHERACAVHAIRAMCRILKIHELATATACVLLHRFYQHRSLQDHPWREIVPSVVFLATKVEEEIRKLQDIVEVACVWRHQLFPDEPYIRKDTEAFTHLRAQILYNEEVMLEALCYDLNIEHPHTYVLRGAALVFEPTNALVSSFADEDVDESRTQRIEKLQRAGWSVASDSFATILCLVHPPKAIAAMALLVGSRMIREPLPVASDKQSAAKVKTRDAFRVKRDWWSMFDISLETLEAGAAILVSRYALSADPHIVSEAKKLASYANQELPNGLATPGTPPLPEDQLAKASGGAPQETLQPTSSQATNLQAFPEAYRVDSSATTPLVTSQHDIVEAEDKARVRAGDLENEISRTAER